MNESMCEVCLFSASSSAAAAGCGPAAHVQEADPDPVAM
jgi:hypothetical protein